MLGLIGGNPESGSAGTSLRPTETDLSRFLNIGILSLTPDVETGLGRLALVFRPVQVGRGKIVRILYFNYANTSFASILRSLEYAKAAADHGHQVVLCYLHPDFRPPESFFDLITAYSTATGNLRVHYPPRAAAASPSMRSAGRKQVAGKVVDSKPTLKGLYRQMAGSLRYVPQELEWVKRSRPDVILARPDQVMSFMVTSRLSKLPLVLECDGPVEELDQHWGLASRWVAPFDTWRAHRAASLLYISEPCRELWLRKRIPAEKLFYTPNAAHPDRFKPLVPDVRRDLRRKFGLEGAKVIGFSGNLRAWHGVDSLIEAAKPLLLRDPGIRILFIGAVDDPSVLARHDLPAQVRERQLVFTGPLPYPAMGDHIDLADCIALPYPSTHLFYFSPMKLFEAMSLGKIIVAPRMGQIGEMLGDLRSPILYHPDEPGALARGLEEALARAGRVPEGGIAGADARARIEAEHTWAHRGRVVVEACEYALERAGRKAAA